jgi:hypothetical protein
MPVRMIFDSGQQYSGRAFADCMQGARTHAIRVVRAQRGMRWSSDDGVTLDILAPSPPTLVDTGDDINENSIVTRLTYIYRPRTFHELFMGDAGDSSEARLLASGIDLRANVLFDEFRFPGRQSTGRGVNDRGGFLDVAVSVIDFLRHAIVADVEVLETALRLRAPIVVSGHLDSA